MSFTPPKPPSRPEKSSLFAYLRAFRKDILSAQPEKLYGAKMAEFKTPFFRSFLVNQPELVDFVLKERPSEFPKSNRIREGLEPLLGNSVFLTNGAEWERQRRIINPAFEGGRLREVLPAMEAASAAMVERLAMRAGDDPVEFEQEASFTAADIIFRTLFSIPITHHTASEVFVQFQGFQRTQPILNLAAFLPIPRWVPRFHRRATIKRARALRGLITELVMERAKAIERGDAPDDLATKIMTTKDPQTGNCFSPAEMVDQVAIFFLAGHETSASALAWAMYLLAVDQDMQRRVQDEIDAQVGQGSVSLSKLGKLRLTRDVFQEALRLYPPVPMMVREAQCPHQFRGRNVEKGAQVVISPWHMQRHTGMWDNPDCFDPDRFKTPEGKAALRKAYLPFSKGARVCPGAGFAMAEGPMILAHLLRAFSFSAADGPKPIPVAHLTVRAKNGIWLKVTPRKNA
ncbi:cytochrome P450 [Halocynthiibacter sp. C4]|uniref:cytochrome P450 n=1 Tax=Halocynthiibacter sp. C4 TaxID=2992758 RepID=UPI00237BA415|nr:cytochrome P450 [Halocynthiibacter sp. C4]MDE0589388.1 cytochrome P450 [Halocynthiibacter sp. C4]